MTHARIRTRLEARSTKTRAGCVTCVRQCVRALAPLLHLCHVDARVDVVAPLLKRRDLKERLEGHAKVVKVPPEPRGAVSGVAPDARLEDGSRHVVGDVARAALVLLGIVDADAVFAPPDGAALLLAGVEGPADKVAVVAGEELAGKEVGGADGEHEAHEEPEKEHVDDVGGRGLDRHQELLERLDPAITKCLLSVRTHTAQTADSTRLWHAHHARAWAGPVEEAEGPEDAHDADALEALDPDDVEELVYRWFRV